MCLLGYNKVLTEVLEVELQMIKAELDDIDNKMQQSDNALNLESDSTHTITKN